MLGAWLHQPRRFLEKRVTVRAYQPLLESGGEVSLGRGAVRRKCCWERCR